MRDVYDFAKYFIKNGADSLPNTFDGNMKLQKLLVFADMIHLAEYGDLLFGDKILAFRNGCVVEKVRLRYKNDYHGLKIDSNSFQPDFSEKEYNALNTAIAIFGDASARELSEINHTFESWCEAYNNGTRKDGFHDKDKSVVDLMSHVDDVEKMREIIDAYKESSSYVMAKEIINGVTFYYDGFTLTDEIIEELEKISLNAEDNAYTVYIDNGGLVVY